MLQASSFMRGKKDKANAISALHCAKMAFALGREIKTKH
jgi:hypothetical protein